MKTVNLTFKVFWRVKNQPHLEITKCKKIINSKTSTLLKYHTRGFFIGGKYIKRKDLNQYLELIPTKEYTPF